MHNELYNSLTGDDAYLVIGLSILLAFIVVYLPSFLGWLVLNYH